MEIEENGDNVETKEIPGVRLNMEDMENLRKVLPELEKGQEDVSQLEIILRAIKYIKDLGDDLKKSCWGYLQSAGAAGWNCDI